MDGPLACRMALVALLPLACSEDPPSSASPLETHLQAEGLLVQRGEVVAFEVEDCRDLTDCFGNNPGAPYLLFAAPGPPSDPTQLPPSDLGAIPSIPDGLAANVQLEPGEALLIVGETPPEARYLGLTPYLFSRVAQDGQRVNTFASLGDSLNQTNLITAGPGPFEASTAIVATADADTAMAVAHALSSEGFAPEQVNLLPLPSERLRMGLGEDDDTFMVLGRTALFADPTRAAAYLADVPLEVYRVTPEAAGTALPATGRTGRGDESSEDHLVGALDALDDAIEASLAGLEHDRIMIPSSGIVALVIDPDRCIEEVSECLGDNGDTTYAAGPIGVIDGQDQLRLDEGDHFIVFGVNHAASGEATYASASVYAQARRMGVITITDDDMVGSAERFLPGHPEREQLFAWEVRRDCSGHEFCRELPTEFPGVALDEDLFFIFRAYLEPGLSVSAGHDELLTERVILVRG